MNIHYEVNGARLGRRIANKYNGVVGGEDPIARTVNGCGYRKCNQIAKPATRVGAVSSNVMRGSDDDGARVSARKDVLQTIYAGGRISGCKERNAGPAGNGTGGNGRSNRDISTRTPAVNRRKEIVWF